MCRFIYIYICTWLYICIYIYIYIYVFIYIWIGRGRWITSRLWYREPRTKESLVYGKKMWKFIYHHSICNEYSVINAWIFSHICMNIHVFICVYIHIYTYVYMYILVYRGHLYMERWYQNSCFIPWFVMKMWIFIHICIYICVYIYVYTYVYIYVCMYVYISI
jgi:hypothetical protein